MHYGRSRELPFHLRKVRSSLRKWLLCLPPAAVSLTEREVFM
uniref:Uncharacterized protein n=1 Tax=Anguilla anguilla TaxID=7936 RepID=A0A0E9SC34_ANGAN